MAQCKSDHRGFATFTKAQIGVFLLVAVTLLLQLMNGTPVLLFYKRS